MNIYMTGINYRKAPIEERERFAFTKSGAAAALQRAVEEFGVQGCVLLTTCNRTELWISGKATPSPFVLLCRLAGVEPTEEIHVRFTDLQGEEAVRHLYELTSGLDSRIFGEDQIITQVGEALTQAREGHASGTVLENLFRSAVTAAKEVKTSVRLGTSHPSVASSAVNLLKTKLGDLTGLDCLVIGNGEMGRLAAEALLLEGCRVSMTLRQYKSGSALIPAGCRVLPYDERLACLPGKRVVVSATRSPHHTLKLSELAGLPAQPRIYLDLAIPRDIDPAIAQMPGAEVYDIDHMDVTVLLEQKNEQTIRVKKVLAEYQESFESWYYFRDFVPIVQEISRQTALDAGQRTQKSLRRLAPGVVEEVSQLMRAAEEKAVSRLLYGLREKLDRTAWDACLSALQAAAYSVETEQEEQGAARCKKEPEPANAPQNEAERAQAETKESLMFPLFVNLCGKKAVVVGGGTIAARRVETLLAFDCAVTVIAPALCAKLQRRETESNVLWLQRCYRTGDCAGAALVTACTDSREANHAIGQECAQAGIPVSVADNREECTFFFPAVVTDSDLTVGLTSCGNNHQKVRRAANTIRSLKDRIFESGADKL